MEDLYDFLDYRDYLKSRFDAVKDQNAWCSYRSIALKLGIDPGQLVKILQKKRHISERLTSTFIDYLKLEEQEAEYFICLIHFNKAKNQYESRLYLDKLMKIKEFDLKKVKLDQDVFYRKWYFSVIRILFAFYHFDGNYEKLGNLLSPPISAKEAQKAVNTLLDLGFIKKEGKNDMKPTERFISGGGNWRMLAVRHFQQQTIELSQNSLYNDPPEFRDISSLTISVKKSELQDFKDMITDFRSALLKKVRDSDQEPDSVYQLNIQLIPVALVNKRGN